MYDANDSIIASIFTEEEKKLLINYPDPSVQWEIEDLKDLLRWGVENQMSDIILSSGEPIWISRLGFKVPVTNRALTVGNVDKIIDETTRTNAASASLKGGDDKNYAYEFKHNSDSNNPLTYRFRANAITSLIPGGMGSTLTMRHIPALPPSLDELNIEPDLRRALQPHDGFVLVAGNTGTGKTTLLGAVMAEILRGFGKSIVTYEDPVEFMLKELPGRKSIIDHHEFQLNFTKWENAPANANRRDPDIVLLGEAKERATFLGMLNLGNIGKACYATLHTSRVRNIITRVLDVFDHHEKPQIATSLVMNLKVLISQRLLVHTNQEQRVAIREYLILKSVHRKKLMETPIEKIPFVLETMVEDDGVSFLSSAQKRLNDGEISQESFDNLKFELE